LISEAFESGTNSKDSLLVLEDPTSLHVRKRGHKTNPGSDNSVPSRCHAWADFQIVFLVLLYPLTSIKQNHKFSKLLFREGKSVVVSLFAK
jgi:hypothetical protein